MMLRHRTIWLRAVICLTAIAVAGLGAVTAYGFCGFYVAQADSRLFNKASKVVLARNEDQTSITMASDYEGDPKEFAVVIPVSTFIERKQIGIVELKTVDHLDRFTAARLVEYFDTDPCSRVMYGMASASASRGVPTPASASEIARRRVVVEASYEVGEYDIQILSAQESDALVAYLSQNGYKIPAGAEETLGSYIHQKMHFFIAKVNLDRMALDGGKFIRPLQVRYQSPKFMLPIRLGTVNANGPQDLIIYALSMKGRVETTNYRTVKMPSGMDVPLYVKDRFSDFYKTLFERQVEKDGMNSVFLEYAWDMSWCDPCAAEPLSVSELNALGARWLDLGQPVGRYSQGVNTFVTRLRVRYDAAHFPEDLQLQETPDETNFQARYVLRHPWTGASTCKDGDRYQASLPARFGKEADQLAELTGWQVADIRAEMEKTGQSFTPPSTGLVRWLERQFE
jgi:hypothetical protein